MNNVQSKTNKIERFKQLLVLTEFDKRNIRHKMKEYYGEYVNDDTLYNDDYSKLKNKINQNNRPNKSESVGPRNIMKFKQSIYTNELKKIITFLLRNLEQFLSFESIILYIAKQRKIIELLKLNLTIYELFGEFRGTVVYNRKYNTMSPIIHSKGKHLISNITNKYETNNCKYKNKQLTIIRNVGKEKCIYGLHWIHTPPELILELLQEMNEIYEEFKSSIRNRNNIEKSKQLLSKLYWLYMQACPFRRGTASIGEIIFSVLLQRHFKCDFKLFRESYQPHIIPDIHALTYPLEHFQSIFWDQFVSCSNKNNNNK